MKKSNILLAIGAISLISVVTACGGGGSGSGGDSGPDNNGGNGDYAYCSADKSFCLKSGQMPSQLTPNKAVAVCPVNSVMIDDQCQQITISLQGNKTDLQYTVLGSTTGTAILSDYGTYDASSQTWSGPQNPTLKYLSKDVFGIYNYYWQSNVPTYVFPALTSTGYSFHDNHVDNAVNYGSYSDKDSVTPVIKFGSKVFDTAQYTYSSFVTWCNALNTEWIKFEDPTDPANPPAFTIKISDDHSGGNFIQCSADVDPNSNKMFKNNAPFVDRFNVMFDCNYQNNNDCKVYGIGDFNK